MRLKDMEELDRNLTIEIQEYTDRLRIFSGDTPLRIINIDNNRWWFKASVHLWSHLFIVGVKFWFANIGDVHFIFLLIYQTNSPQRHRPDYVISLYNFL